MQLLIEATTEEELWMNTGLDFDLLVRHFELCHVDSGI